MCIFVVLTVVGRGVCRQVNSAGLEERNRVNNIVVGGVEAFFPDFQVQVRARRRSAGTHPGDLLSGPGSVPDLDHDIVWPHVHVGEFVDGTVEIVGDDCDSRFAAGARDDGAYLAGGDGVDRFVVAGPMSWPRWKVEPPTTGMQRPPMGELIRWFFAFSGSTKPSAPVSGLAFVSNGVSATAGNAPKAKAAAIAPEKVRVSIAIRASLAVSTWSCTWTPCTASMVVRVFGACELTGTRLMQESAHLPARALVSGVFHPCGRC